MTAWEIGRELFGGDEDTVRQSTINIANECRDAGFLLVPVDFQEVRITPKGLDFIGRSGDE